MIGVLLVWLTTAAACALNVANQNEAAASSGSATASSQVQSNTGEIVTTVPISAPQTTALPDRSDSGGGGATSNSTSESAPQTAQTPTGIVLTYTEITYNFTIQYPADFITRTLSSEKLAQLKPTPAMIVGFINPQTAASSIAELEPADLEIRAYNTAGSALLEEWLTTNALLPTDGSVTPKPFQTVNTTGVQICAATMIAPGCSYFIKGIDWVYQLTPATVAGEAMINSFMLNP